MRINKRKCVEMVMPYQQNVVLIRIILVLTILSRHEVPKGRQRNQIGCVSILFIVFHP